MGKGFFHSDMQFFVDQRVDWGRYVRLKRGPEVNPGEEVATYRAILQSIGEVCEAIESDSHGHWYDEVLVDMTDALRAYLATEPGQADPQHTDLQAELDHNLQLVRFFTPLCKYYATELSNHVTRQAIQVCGGIGYMAETVLGHRHADSIITTIYEGTSEIQASFALKEMSKGALFTALEDVRAELLPLRERHEQPVQLVFTGIGWINSCLGALTGDSQYALLNAKRLCEMVIDVVVAAELLLQGDVGDEARRQLARSFASLNIPVVELNARRIAAGDSSRLRDYDRILGLG